MASADVTFIQHKILKLLPHLNQTEKLIFFCLNSWTSPNNRTGMVYEGIIADQCKMTRRGVRLVLRRLETRGIVKCIPTNDGIIFHLVPPPAVKPPVASSDILIFKESTSLLGGTGQSEIRNGTEEIRNGTEEIRNGTERPNNWVQIDHSLIRNNLSGNALAIYAVMLSRNTHKWTVKELMDSTGLCFDSFYKAIPTLSALIIGDSKEGWRIKNPVLKKYPKKKKKEIVETESDFIKRFKNSPEHVKEILRKNYPDDKRLFE